MRHIDRYLSSLFLAAAIAAPAAIMADPRPQNGSAQVVLARELVRPAITDRAVSIPLLAASFRINRDPVIAPVQFNRVFLGTNQPFQSVEGFPPMDEFKTVFFTRSSFSLVQFWSGRLQLDAFQSTLHVQSVQLAPSGPRAIHLSGLSLGFHFGRDTGAGHRSHTWRRLSRIVGGALD
jgi:hypothetical protein